MPQVSIISIALAVVLWLGLRVDDDQPPIVGPPTAPALGPRPSPPKKPAPTPPPATKPAPAHVNAPSAAEVAKLYGAVGRELKALDIAKGLDATIELWPRYRWIRFNDWITTPEKRVQITRELERLRADIKAAI